MTGGFFCGKCGSDAPPKVSSEVFTFKVKCVTCGHAVEAVSMRDALRKWEEKANVKEEKR